MRALLYLTWRSFVNNVKRALKKPITLILIILLGVYAVYVLFMVGKLVTELRFDSADGLIALVSVWTIYIFLSDFLAYSSRKGVIFRQAHPHFVFPAPISPKLILIHSAWMNYLTSVVVSLLFVLAGVTVFSVEPWRMALFFFVGCILELLLEVSVMVFMYTNETLPERFMKGLSLGIKIFLGAMTLFLVLYFRREGFSLATVSAFFDWPGLQMIPVVGWNIAAYRLILTGPTTLNMVCTALYACTVAAAFLTARHMRCEGAYYEDAAKFADDYAEMKRKQSSGEMVTGIGEKKRKFRRISGDYRASGAKAVFYRQLLEYKKERWFIFTKATVINLAASAVMAFALRQNVGRTEVPQLFLLGMTAYMTLVFSGITGKWETELKSPYLFLIPDTPFKKLWYATLMEHIKAFVDGIVLCVPMGAVWGVSPGLILMTILIYTVLHANKMYTRVVAQCLVGDFLGKTGQDIIRMLLQMFIIGIGVMAAVAAGILIHVNLVFPIILIYSIIVTAVMGALASVRFDTMEQMN